MSYTFQGYRRPDGKFGARNLVAVIPTTICANDVAQAICRQIQGTIGYFHHQGCCQLPSDLKRVTEVLIDLGLSANVGAALIVSLGCEGPDHQRVYETIKASGKPCEIIHIQELGGTSAGIQAGMDAAQRLVMQISGQQRETCDISNLTMAIKCGGSDTTSGMASNCVIGYVADRLVDLGATVIFGETTEFIGGEHLVADKLVDLGATVVFGETTEFLGGEHILANRAVGGPDGPVAKKIYEIVERMENRAKAIGEDMRGGQPTPGNIAGGLSSIEEKSLGAIVKSGHRPIQGVLEYTDRITDQKGLWIKDTPGREPEILTGMAATGAQVLMFSTGRGAPLGFCSMPVIKICGNPITYARMSHDMDLNAGRIITGEKTIEQVGEEAFEMLLKVLSGQMTKNEALSYFGSIDIYCLGPVI